MTEDTYFSMKWPKYEDAGLGTDMLFPGQHLIVPKLLSFFKKLRPHDAFWILYQQQGQPDCQSQRNSR